MSVAFSTSFRTYVKQKQGSLERQVEKMRRMDQQKKWIKGVGQGREFYEKGHVDNWPDLLSITGQGVFREGQRKVISSGLMTTGKNAGVMIDESSRGFSLGQALIRNGQKMAGIGEKIGKWMPGVGFTIETADDYFSQRRTLGNAVAYNGVVTGVGALATWGVGALMTAGAPEIVAGMLAGITATLIFDEAYKHNFLGTKNLVDGIGKFLDPVLAKLPESVTYISSVY